MKRRSNVSKISHTPSKYKHKSATIQIHSTLVRIIPRLIKINSRCFVMRSLSCVHTDSTGTRHPLPDVRTQLIYATRCQMSEHNWYTSRVNTWQTTNYILSVLPDVSSQLIYAPPRCQMSEHKWYTTPIARFQNINDICPPLCCHSQNTTDIYHSLPICDIMSPG